MRPEKRTIVADLQKQFEAAPFILLIEYSGLNVDHFSELRSRLHGVGASCQVIKNSFVKRAAKESGLPDISGELSGQTAMVLGDSDVCAAAKVLKTFASEFDKPALKAGVLDGELLDAGQIQALAELPAREVLLAQLLGVLQAPASKLARTLNEPAASFARLLKAKAEQDA